MTKTPVVLSIIIALMSKGLALRLPSPGANMKEN